MNQEVVLAVMQGLLIVSMVVSAWNQSVIALAISCILFVIFSAYGAFLEYGVPI